MPELIDLELLENPPKTPSPGLSDDDPDKSKASLHFSLYEYEEAGQIAAAIFTRRVFDVRMVPALLMGAFVERGVRGLAAILRALTQLLDDDLASFGPEKRKNAVCDISLTALFHALLTCLETHHEQRDADWSSWIFDSDDELVTGIVNECAAVREAAKRALGEGKCVDEIDHLRTWFDDSFRQYVERQSVVPALALMPDPPPCDPAKPAPSRKPTQPPPSPPDLQPIAPAGAPGSAPREPAHLTEAPDTLDIKPSPALKLLLQKLEAFQLLIERDQLQKAAVVAHDLEKLLTSFDPRVYLPGLLSSYFAALSARVDDLAPYLNATEGRSWRALEAFYQVDLDAFVKDPDR